MNHLASHHELAVSRRDFFARAGGGFGLLALHSLLQSDALAAESVRPAHFEGKAKSIIWLFLDGGPSHIDLFDPKPELAKLAGQPLPSSFKRPVTAMGKTAYTP